MLVIELPEFPLSLIIAIICSHNFMALKYTTQMEVIGISNIAKKRKTMIQLTYIYLNFYISCLISDQWFFFFPFHFSQLLMFVPELKFDLIEIDQCEIVETLNYQMSTSFTIMGFVSLLKSMWLLGEYKKEFVFKNTHQFVI